MAVSEPKDWFETELPGAVQADPGKVKDFNGTLLFNITGDNGGSWTVDIHDQKLNVTADGGEKPDITITMKDSDFVDFVNKKLAGQMAFMTGKLKVKGNMALAMKLQGLI